MGSSLLKELGKEEAIADLSVAIGLSSIPSRAVGCHISVNTQDIRYTINGDTPTASVGHLLAAGGIYEFVGALDQLKFIETTASATARVSYLGHA